MNVKGFRPNETPPDEVWFVYVLRCADGSLYTGITKDQERRCQQHNAGKASRFTRCRLPVELVYQESHANRGLALRREAAIKALSRRQKESIILNTERKAERPNMKQYFPQRSKKGRNIARLEDIPNIGPSVADDLRQLGITSPTELVGRDPYAMYTELCRITGQKHDPCLLDTFIAAVRYMEGEPKKPWWKYTEERKRELTARMAAKK